VIATHDPIPLWPGVAPGTIGDAKRAHEPAAKESPNLVPFPLKDGTPRAAVIVCPGGGYGVRAAHEGEPVALWLNSLGIAAFVCHYRVAPFRHPVPLGDAQRAVRLVRARAAEWHVDPARIGMLGFSAGGHLACAAANFGEDAREHADPIERQASRLQACIACYPVISYGEHGHRGSFANLLGEGADPAVAQRLSLETSVTAGNPPTFIWHTADDAAVSVQNPLLYAAALARQRVPVSLHVYPRGPHGLGLAQEFAGMARGWTGACAEWLAEIGFRA
jgi:acetyl esterase/lipase